MSNPYAETPLWARYYSSVMGWPITKAVADATDGQPVCDSCGSLTTRDLGNWDPERGKYEVVTRPLTLEADYCFGCGSVTCARCEAPSDLEKHGQSDHAPGRNPVNLL